MTHLSGFIAYPNRPKEIGETIGQAVAKLRNKQSGIELKPWEESEILGRFLAQTILSDIDNADVLIADITKLNFNVTYEIGYAIAKNKRLVLVSNPSYSPEDELVRQIGIFDTIGYEHYENSDELVQVIESVSNKDPIRFINASPSLKSPLFLVLPERKTDFETTLQARIKKSKFNFRAFDPEEMGRMPGSFALENVSDSYGVITPLLSSERSDAKTHNIRAAFVLGLARGLDILALGIQTGDQPVPMDFRDLAKSIHQLQDIEKCVHEFALEVTEALQSNNTFAKNAANNALAEIPLGASAAENEMSELDNYYLKTDEFYRASKGEAQIVSGRKGSGKTALFIQIRNTLRRDSQNVVLDLKPDGFRLVELKERVLDRLRSGTHEHTITVFWKYLLLLELCHKLLATDRKRQYRDSRLTSAYAELASSYESDEYVSEGDFAERMLMLTRRISEDFQRKYGSEDAELALRSPDVTELIHKHDYTKLRDSVISYLKLKNEVWILFDNLDKGWRAQGIDSDDLITLNCLLDAMNDLQRSFRKKDISCFTMVFIRNDVYELMVEGMPDRGKHNRINLDWTDPSLLRELLRRRLVSDLDDQDTSFEDVWRAISTSHIKSGEESSGYLIDRSLMRPRNLIDIVKHCRSHAVNLGHSKLEEVDILNGEKAYSNDLLQNISYEIRDVFPNGEDLLYEFIGAEQSLSLYDVHAAFSRVGISQAEHEHALELLLWYGFLGLVRDDGEVDYIYDSNYNLKIIKAKSKQRDPNERAFAVNPAFLSALNS